MAVARKNKSAKKLASGSIRWMVLIYLGFSMLVAGGDVTSVLMGAILIALGVFKLIRAAAGKGPKKRTRNIPEKKEQSNLTSFIKSEPEEELIVRELPMKDKQLEQLECLYAAGMYTREEYLEKKKSIHQRGY